LDNKTNILLIEKYGTMLENKGGVRCYYLQSSKVHTYSYAIYNENDYAIEAALDCSSSEMMVFSTKTASSRKIVQPKMLEFMMHA